MGIPALPPRDSVLALCGYSPKPGDGALQYWGLQMGRVVFCFILCSYSISLGLPLSQARLYELGARGRESFSSLSPAPPDLAACCQAAAEEAAAAGRLAGGRASLL